MDCICVCWYYGINRPANLVFPFDASLSLGQIIEKSKPTLMYNEMKTKKPRFVKFIKGKPNVLVNSSDPYWPDNTPLTEYMAFYGMTSKYCWLYYVIV